jgi:hypothetical protein
MGARNQRVGSKGELASRKMTEYLEITFIGFDLEASIKAFNEAHKNK